MDKDSKRAYIDALTESLKSQKNYVLLLITFDFGLLALIAKNLVFLNPKPIYAPIELAILTTTMSFFLLSGVFLFWWFSKLQRLSQECVDLHYSLDIESSRNLHFGGLFWEKHGWVYNIGISFLWLAILAGSSMVAYVLFR